MPGLVSNVIKALGYGLNRKTLKGYEVLWSSPTSPSAWSFTIKMMPLQGKQAEPMSLKVQP